MRAPALRRGVRRLTVRGPGAGLRAGKRGTGGMGGMGGKPCRGRTM